MKKEPKDKSTNNVEEPQYPSHPYPTIIVLYLLFFLIAPFTGIYISLALFFGLMGLCFWNAISLKSYKKIREHYPHIDRSYWIINGLLFPVIIPLLIFLGVMVYKFVI